MDYKEAQAELDKIEDSTCTCDTCQNMCTSRPCWATPEEAAAIIKAGLGGGLWLDYWAGGFDGREDDVYILSPAAVGYRGKSAPFIPTGRCTFLTDLGMCELHDKGLKPVEGRKAIHGARDRAERLHELVARTWDREDAQHLALKDWRGT